MIFILKLDPYKHDILFALDETPESLAMYMRRTLHYPNESIESIPPLTTQGNTSMFSKGETLLRLKEVPNGPVYMALLVHEIVHAVSFILRRVGIEHTSETEEAYTYAIQDVTERAFRRIGKEYWK
jgi:hypothetical protein